MKRGMQILSTIWGFLESLVAVRTKLLSRKNRFFHCLRRDLDIFLSIVWKSQTKYGCQHREPTAFEELRRWSKASVIKVSSRHGANSANESMIIKKSFRSFRPSFNAFFPWPPLLMHNKLSPCDVWTWISCWHMFQGTRLSDKTLHNSDTNEIRWVTNAWTKSRYKEQHRNDWNNNRSN